MKPFKLLLPLLCALLLCGSFGCQNGPDLDLTYRDADRYYYMDAEFDKRKTRRVEHYINKSIGKESNIPFVRVGTNTELRLADNTNFHLRKEPGRIVIKLDKRENTEQGYRRVKSMCEGIKALLTQ